MNWRIVLAIARKDILDAIKNLYLLFSLVLPVGLSLLFRLMFSPTGELGTLTIAVHDPGNSRLVAQLRQWPQVKLVDVTALTDLPGVVEKQAVGGLAVPTGFDAAILAGERPELTVFVNLKRGGGELAAFQRLVER